MLRDCTAVYAGYPFDMSLHAMVASVMDVNPDIELNAGHIGVVAVKVLFRFRDEGRVHSSHFGVLWANERLARASIISINGKLVTDVCDPTMLKKSVNVKEGTSVEGEHFRDALQR